MKPFIIAATIILALLGLFTIHWWAKSGAPIWVLAFSGLMMLVVGIELTTRK